MVTINNLEVSFDVEGEGDEAVFAKLFEKHMRRWSRHEQEQQRRQRQAEADRALGDRQAGEGE
jgi:hypothetical protein